MLPDVLGGLPASLLFIISASTGCGALAGNLETACLFLQICRRDSVVVKDGRVQSSLELTTKENRRGKIR